MLENFVLLPYAIAGAGEVEADDAGVDHTQRETPATEVFSTDQRGLLVCLPSQCSWHLF